MNYNIAICDDDINQIEYLKPIITSWAKENKHPITVSAFPSAEAFLFEHDGQNDVDITNGIHSSTSRVVLNHQEGMWDIQHRASEFCVFPSSKKNITYQEYM